MKIAEIFYSIQGEGALVGVPSVFVRASGHESVLKRVPVLPANPGIFQFAGPGRRSAALLRPDGTWVWGCDEDFWPWLLEVGAGVVEDRLVVVLGEPPEREGEVEVEPDVVLDPEEELLELAGGGGGALLVVVVEVLELELVLAGVQEPDTKVAPTGRATCCGVVPGGAST